MSWYQRLAWSLTGCCSHSPAADGSISGSQHICVLVTLELEHVLAARAGSLGPTPCWEPRTVSTGEPEGGRAQSPQPGWVMGTPGLPLLLSLAANLAS